tara:strand:- start:5811 stop:5963 length:153 start_codon:yes stop_codon:yes gene_type:complete
MVNEESIISLYEKEYNEPKKYDNPKTFVSCTKFFITLDSSYDDGSMGNLV